MSDNDDVLLSTSLTNMKTYGDDNTNVFTWVEFAKEAEVTEERAKELLDIGWLQPINTPSDGETVLEHEKALFHQLDVFKARKANRLCMDFELPSLAGAMIVDLLEKIDDLEARLKEKE